VEITATNINDIVKKLKQKIHAASTALTVSIYNNKGGVGKTTTTVNLAAILTAQGKRVLVIDFDPNQKDLTVSLNIKPNKPLLSLLEDKSNTIAFKDVAVPYSIKTLKKTLIFDVIPCDEELGNKSENDLYKSVKISKLKQILDKVKADYDYILIDSPPNWRFFSMSAILAADVVLIPTKHNNIFSLNNAAITITKYIPAIQGLKKDGTPIALPIFWNGEKITPAAKETTQKAMDQIISRSQKDSEPFDLFPYFYPRYTGANKDRYVFEIPGYANIASATFAQVPSVYKDKTAHDYYLQLAKEYFLQ
jgi:cellulose biosynthesis protein BcsQ